MDQLTSNEKRVIESLRALDPFEKIVIEADKQGKYNNYLIQTSRAIMLTDEGPIYVKVYKTL